MKNVIEYIMIFVGSLLVAGLIVFLFVLLTGCNVFRSLKKEETKVQADTTSVKKESESLVKVDTSKSKSESTYTKETFYYGRDTIINNIIQPIYYTKETGSKKDETQNFNYETRERQIVDSMRIANLESRLTQKSESKVKVGPSLIEWILIAGVGLLLIKNFIPLKLAK